MSGAALTARSERISLLRLGYVEGRKMLDTRAGLWLVALTILSAVGRRGRRARHRRPRTR